MPDRPPRKPSTAALFVRIPATQARQLDRAAFELKLPKQQLVTHLLERYVDPDSPQSLRALGANEKRPGPLTVDASTTTVGHHSFRPAESEVLTAQEVAELLQVELSTVLELSTGGKLPGRELAGQWRFSRAAVLRWLEGESA